MVPYRERPAAALLFAMRRAAFTVRTNIRPPAVATTSHLTACRAPTRAATAACTRRTPGCLCTRATLAAASWPPRRAASRRRCGRGPRPARSLSRPASVPPRGQTSTHCLACETAANASRHGIVPSTPTLCPATRKTQSCTPSPRLSSESGTVTENTPREGTSDSPSTKKRSTVNDRCQKICIRVAASHTVFVYTIYISHRDFGRGARFDMAHGADKCGWSQQALSQSRSLSARTKKLCG